MGKTIYHALEDPNYRDFYTDVEEMQERTLSDGTKIPFRYVHGGFKQEGVKFSLCIPLKENFTGRFFQYLSPFPGPDEEMVSLKGTGEDDKVAFSLSNGAYFVESNMGSKYQFGSVPDATKVWKSSAAVAEYSRKYVMDLYGCGRPYGYVFGGSGGGYKTMACIENTDAWDGAVPYVIGSPVSLPNTIVMHVQAQRRLRGVLPQIFEAVDVGGSGDMYAGLNDSQKAMLKEITQMGFPPKAWFTEAVGIEVDGALAVLLPGVKQADPGYFKDFWEVDGYLGADPDSQEAKDRLQFTGVVKRVKGPQEESGIREAFNNVDNAWRKQLVDANGAWIELEEIPHGDDLYLKGVSLTVMSGEAKGVQLAMDTMIPAEDGKGGYLIIGATLGMTDLAGVLARIRPGDEIFIDNSDYIAIQSYYRHQVPDDLSFHAWDQFRDENGRPTLPQRKKVIGYGYTGTGTVQDGNIQGKVIMVQALLDESTCPWCADWYRHKVIEAKGNEDDYRLYYMEYCCHGDVAYQECTFMTNYLGALHQALLDLSDWVERGIEPLPPTRYTYDNGQIYVPDTAEERKGIQSVVRLTANGGEVAKVRPGEPVTFRIEVTVPEGAGSVTAMDMAFDEKRHYEKGEEEKILLDDPFTCPVEFEIIPGTGCSRAVGEKVYVYDKPGAHYATVRVKSNRKGDRNTDFGQIRNLGRTKIIVEE